MRRKSNDKNPGLTALFAAGLAILLPFSLLAEVDDPGKSGEKEIEAFSIVFFKNKVRFSGTIDSEKNATAIAEALLSARPDLSVVNSGLNFNTTVKLPDLILFQNLVTEVGLSTHEGEIILSRDRLLVGGLSDSIVTSSVLRVRAKPILEGRIYTDRICQVPTEDLPVIPVYLSNGESRKGFSFDFSMQEKEPVEFVPPGLIPGKILNLIEGTRDMGLLLTGKPTPELPEITSLENAPNTTLAQLDDTAPKIETAVVLNNQSPEAESQHKPPPPPPPPAPTEKQAPAPKVHSGSIGPILFARNSFTLQSGQRENLSAVSSRLASPAFKGKSITIQSVQYKSGADAFANWLSQKRLAEVLGHFKKSGINPGLIRSEYVVSREQSDQGEVRIRVKGN